MPDGNNDYFFAAVFACTRRISWIHCCTIITTAPVLLCMMSAASPTDRLYDCCSLLASRLVCVFVSFLIYLFILLNPDPMLPSSLSRLFSLRGIRRKTAVIAAFNAPYYDEQPATAGGFGNDWPSAATLGASPQSRERITTLRALARQIGPDRRPTASVTVNLEQTITDILSNEESTPRINILKKP